MQKSNYIDDFKKYIKCVISNYKVEEEIKEALEYVLVSNGKYIRPSLFLSFIEDNGKEVSDYFDIALSLEMIHTYSLIHDDLPALDNDDYRRGKESCHKKFGEDVAILIGDALLTNSFEQILINKKIDNDLKVKITKEVINSAGIEGMILGQYLDIKNMAQDIATLEKMHILKTSKMISLPIVLAALICNVDMSEESKETLEQIGLHYQILDDYLDLYGENIGKTPKKDLENNKRTYTYYYDKKEIEEILKKKEERIENTLKEFEDYKLTKKLILGILKRDK